MRYFAHYKIMKIITNGTFEIAYDETKAEEIKKEIPDYIQKERKIRQRLFSLKLFFLTISLGILVSMFILIKRSTNYAGLLIPFIFLLAFTVFLNLYHRTKLISKKKALKFKENYAKEYIALINYLENFRLVSVVSTWEGFIFKFIDEHEYVYKLIYQEKEEKYYTIREKYNDKTTSVIDLTTFDWKQDLEKTLEDLE